MRFRIAFILMCLPFLGQAQSVRHQLVREQLANLAESLPEDYDFSEWEGQIAHFLMHPIDLNRTNVEELNALGFLSPLQINDLLLHRKNYGPLIDLVELQQIESLDITTLRLLLATAKVDFTPIDKQINYSNLVQFGRHELLFRVGMLVETAKGYTEIPGSRYLGSKERLMLKYRYTFGSKLSASFVLEKDAGETLAARTFKITDFQSFHLALNRVGHIDKIVVGDYTLQFGQGLTLWSGFSYGKSPDVSSIVSKSVGLKAYSSVNEYAFFRGSSSQIALSERIKWTPFISLRKLDASLTLNTLGQLSLSSINETGLHRTASEIENHRKLNQLLLGNAIEYQTEKLTIGAIAYYQKFSHPFAKTRQLYTAHQFQGNRLMNMGLHYRFSRKNTFYFGEVSKGSTGKWGFINGLVTSISGRLSAVLAYRNYAKDFHNLYSEAMAEGSESSNENGIYAGFNFAASKAMAISLYVDYFKFPWLKFRVDAPSAGLEYLTQFSYAPNKALKTVLKYKLEFKQQNTDEPGSFNFLENISKHVLTSTVNWQKSKVISFQSRLELVKFNKGERTGEYGFLLAQDLDCSPPLAKVSANMRIAYFRSQGYDSRMYAYEDDVLYNISFGMYNGKGWRTYLNLNYKLRKNFAVWLRYALFFYPEMTSIGSGLDEIPGNKKTDLKLQMRIQF